MVRFGVPAGTALLTLHSGFNSSMVRFGAKQTALKHSPDMTFQFQYGAIWRCGSFAVLLRRLPFQFQYGAIWSALPVSSEHERKCVSIPVWCDLETQRPIERAFNDNVSIPVWCDLELFQVGDKHRRHRGFNSSMVRFGAIGKHRSNVACLFQFQYGAIWSSLNESNRRRDWKFQFQYGAIWRLLRLMEVEVVWSFNSSMVRFGAIFLIFPISFVLGFQFQYGAIWSIAKRYTNLPQKSFNSSMVRFGESVFVKKLI